MGDIQGCAREFDDLLELVGFSSSDQLWLVGDLVNRGNDSAGVLQRVLELAGQTQVVLGNHDLHLLAIYFGGHKPSGSDTFADVLRHPNMQDFADYLVNQPLLYRDHASGWTMTHAGIPHIWTLQQAEALAQEVHRVLRNQSDTVSRQQFFQGMYGNEPACWNDSLEGLPRIKLITNYFTRMRLIQPDGTLDFSHKGALSERPPGWTPWYELAAGEELIDQLVFGHWASLDGKTTKKHIHALDTGCVYGRQLTALRLQDQQIFQVSARQQYSA